jgi:AcrR family transcriptional regulator
MSPRTKKQYIEIREERKAQIKKVALEVISEEGFQNTSISKIAQRAGISKGLMYNYFESKEEMIREILYDGMDKFIAIFDPNKDGVLTDSEVKYFIDEVFIILKSNIKYWRLYVTVMLQPGVRKLVSEKFQEMVSPFMSTLISYFTSKGSTQPGVDAKMVLALFDGICFHYIIDPKHFPMGEIKHRLFQQMILS